MIDKCHWYRELPHVGKVGCWNNQNLGTGRQTRLSTTLRVEKLKQKLIPTCLS